MNRRVNVAINGAVQGVGFRPFIYNLAKKLELNGFVLNNSSGVFIEAEGNESNIKTFLTRIEKEKPPLSNITSFEYSFLDPIGLTNFIIKKSEPHSDISTIILPDITVCKDCLEEMWNPMDRRYLYPFINCTNCGPRFSIIESLPYDRPNTSMKNFEMCEKCRDEYVNPSNRRFHAQPIACPECGPQLSFWNKKGEELFVKQDALQQAVKAIKKGKIVAIKGLGGFQLVCDATNDQAVKNLRRRKNRSEKPFAIMFKSVQLVKNICHVSATELRALLSPESPIVLLKLKNQKSKNKISSLVAPNNPYFGIMLPYTPLHHLLMNEIDFPIIATSGNLSEEPICIDEHEALDRLQGIADYFLVHNRPIVRHVDDSIVRIIMNREMMIRRARGYAPLPLIISHSESQKNILAVGGHLKNTIALKKNNHIFISQHIGDLSTEESNKTFTKVIKDFLKLYDVKPDLIINDLHPDYLSTKYANELHSEVRGIQHHRAHIAACRLENQVHGDALGVSWDGTGYGDDGSIWGGEFFLSTDSSFEHIAQFRKFKLPGVEAAIKEPRRSLAGMLYEMNLFDIPIMRKMFSSRDLKIFQTMLLNNYNSPETSSVGRIFDAVSALLGVCKISEFEGQAAMMLEFIADPDEKNSYEFKFVESEKITVDWQPMIEGIIRDKKGNVGKSIISAKFHNTLVKIIDDMAGYYQVNKIILSGGCFQNAYLLEKSINLLTKKGRHVYWHQRIPTNDGGISVGQIAAFLIESSQNNFLKKVSY